MEISLTILLIIFELLAFPWNEKKSEKYYLHSETKWIPIWKSLFEFINLLKQ